MPTIGQFLIERVKSLTSHVFGVPGDYALNFYDQLNNKVKIIGTTDEQCAGFAADAYARINGFSCACVTYCVGGFKILNPIAGAFAEKSPVLLISGSPGLQERNSDLLLHHMSGAFESQFKAFQQITCASTILDDPSSAGYDIDRVINAIKHYKQPGYIELPRDMVDKNIKYDVYGNKQLEYKSNTDNLKESLENSLNFIEKSRNPVILAGVEIARFNLGKELLSFAERHNIPIACTILGKSVINERHPLFLGIYSGAASNETTKQYVEQSDCLIMLGVMQTDVNLAFQPLKCNQKDIISSNTNLCHIKCSKYEKVNFYDFALNLLESKISPKINSFVNNKNIPPFIATNEKIKVARLFEKINSILDKNMAIIADVGDSLFGASDLVIHDNNQFLAPAFYTSMGFAIPAALGVGCAKSTIRNIVLVGDGAFQMTGVELSNVLKHKMNPIIFVLNNKGYTTERFLLDGTYNDIHEWDYYKITDMLKGGKGYLVNTEQDLECAISSSLLNDCFSIIQVNLDKMDSTPALKRMTSSLSRKI